MRRAVVSREAWPSSIIPTIPLARTTLLERGWFTDDEVEIIARERRLDAGLVPINKHGRRLIQNLRHGWANLSPVRKDVGLI